MNVPPLSFLDGLTGKEFNEDLQWSLFECRMEHHPDYETNPVLSILVELFRAIDRGHYRVIAKPHLIPYRDPVKPSGGQCFLFTCLLSEGELK